MMNVIMLVALLGCSDDSTEPSEEGSAAPANVWSAADVERTWVFKAADANWRGKFEGDPGWTALFNRDYESALSGSSGASAVRMYSEFASVYRQATLMHAHATNHIYDTDRQDEDGNDTLYLRGVARSVLAQYETAKTDFASVEDEKLKGMSTQWSSVLDGGWTSDKIIEGSFVNVPPVKMGAKFRPESIPHFTISTTVEGASSDATDTTELWVRSRWYEAVAREAAKQATIDERWIDVFMAPWVVPMEFDTAKSQSEGILAELKPEAMNEGWLFLSRNLVADDALFLYALQFSDAPSDTLNVWSEKSLLAKILLSCVLPEGNLDVPSVLDAASQLELDILESMKASQGKEEPFYPLFADFAEQAVLIAGVMVAERLDQREDSGRLRLNARDLALQNSKDALFLTSFAAWDVENRYPLRAQDMIHKYNGDFPAFKVAGHPLGTLQIRLGRSAGVPGAAN